MIAFVRGVVVEKIANSVVVDVAGIGYEIQIAANDFDRVNLNEEVKFYTYHHVREQSEELFGFSTLIAKRIFELLITVQGVGPKAAIAILSLGEIEMVRSAIASADSGFVARASGVGKKTAERVTVDLHDKVGLPGLGSSSSVGLSSVNDEAIDAMIALGYSLADATAALAGVPYDLSTAERIKLALKQK